MEIIIFIAIVVGIIVWKKKKKEATNDTGDGETEEQVENITMALTESVPVHWYENGEKKDGTAKMSSNGLQVYDSDGNITLDITDRVAKVLGVYQITTMSGSITIEDRQPWVIMIDVPEAYQVIRKHGDNQYTPHIWIDGNKICWDEVASKSGKFYYGVY